MTIISVGSKLGRYTIESELGKGGMSVVYRARDPQLERVVAIKVMHDFLATNTDARKRFHREAIAVAKLEHPNIIKVLDFPDEDVTPLYIVMEFVDGQPLSSVLADGSPLGPPELSLLVGRALCDALAHAHAAGVIHRDLKPENVLVGHDGTLKLTDFGIARLVDTQSMTMTGTLLGSPAFMAPEYIEGQPTDHRVDIFAFGAMLYQLTTGHLPFCGDTPATLLHAIAKGEYIPAGQHNPSIHSQIARIIDSCIAHSPDDRYGDANGAVEAMDAFLGRVQLDPNSNENLRSALASPYRFGAEIELSLGSTYIELAKTEIREGNHGEGLEDLDRVMSLDPDNHEVHQILAKLQRRAAYRKVLMGIGLALLCGVVVGLGSVLIDRLPKQTPGALAIEPTSAPAQPPTAIEATPNRINVTFLLDGGGPLVIDGELIVEDDRDSHSIELLPGTHLVRYGPAGREIQRAVIVPDSGAVDAVKLVAPSPTVSPAEKVPGPIKEAPAPAAVEPRDVAFTALGNWVDVEVDGQVRAEGKMGKFSLSLGPGEHLLRFSHDYSAPLELPVVVGPSGTEPSEPIIIKLKPHDAKLFWGAFGNGSILTIYDGREVSKPYFMNDLLRPDPVMVPLEPGQGSREKRVKVLGGEGTLLFDGPVTFRAGQSTRLGPPQDSP